MEEEHTFVVVFVVSQPQSIANPWRYTDPDISCLGNSVLTQCS
jgi:hypothetical protein